MIQIFLRVEEADLLRDQQHLIPKELRDVVEFVILGSRFDYTDDSGEAHSTLSVLYFEHDCGPEAPEGAGRWRWGSTDYVPVPLELSQVFNLIRGVEISG